MSDTHSKLFYCVSSSISIDDRIKIPEMNIGNASEK